MKRIIAFATVVMLLMFSTVSVMAEVSPTSETKYKVTIGTTSSSTSVSVEPGSITTSSNEITEGEEITLTATENDGFTFSTWVIDGEYELVDGYSLTDKVIVIIPLSDVTINAEFVDADGETSTTDGTGSDDTSATSPKTGESAAAVVITLLAACAVATVARKRIAE